MIGGTSRNFLFHCYSRAEMILLCILCYLGAVAAQFAVPEDLRMFLLPQKPGSDSNYESTPCPAGRVRA